jgi:ABC-type nickel/cobalt efflux system permease component RcnA
MKKNIAIQLKAAALLIVFSLNTILGFACAIGIDMGYNSKHHHHDETKKTETMHEDVGDKQHQHQHENKHQHDLKKSTEKNDCCNDNAISFQKIDKALDSSLNTLVKLPAFVLLVNDFQTAATYKYAGITTHQYLLPLFHPPPPDILVLIRRFQI